MENLEQKTKIDSVEETSADVALKKPRAKKAVVSEEKTAAEADVKKPRTKKTVADAETALGEEKPVSEAGTKKPRAKKAVADAEVALGEEKHVSEADVKKPRAKKTVADTEVALGEEKPAEEVSVKKPRAKKAAADVDASVDEEKPAAEVSVKKPRVKKAVKVEEEKVEKTEEVKEVEKTEEVEEVEDDEVLNIDEPSNLDEDSSEPVANSYREMGIVKGRIVEVLPAQAEKKLGKKVIKAKEERLLIVLEDGQEGFLFKKDTEYANSEEELFDIYIEGDDILVAIKKIFPDGGKFIFSTLLVAKHMELTKFEKTIKERPIINVKVQKIINDFGYICAYNDLVCLLPIQLTNQADNPHVLIGQDIDVIPIRIDYSRLRIIVSQNHANSKKVRQNKKEFLNTLEMGQVFEGTVKNIESYGAFVEISPGVEGLLHISEIDHKRVNKIEKVLAIGEKIQVQIIKLEKDHIGLSKKSLIPNHWVEYFDKHNVNDIIDCTVIEINKVGIKVSLCDDVEGFIPRSEFSWNRDFNIEENVKIGDVVKGKLIEVEKFKRRVIISTKRCNTNHWEEVRINEGDIIDVTIQSVSPEGFKVNYLGLSGYMSKGTVKSRDPESIKEGEVIRARIRIYDASKQRLVLSMRDAEERVEKENYSKYMKSQDKISSMLGDFFANENKKNKKRK